VIRFFQYLALARRTLLEHKLRSFLTMLGIIFGVAAVIAMTGIGEGGKKAALREISMLGIRNIFIRDLAAVRKTAFEKGTAAGEGLTMADVAFLRQSMPGVEGIATAVERDLFVQGPGHRSRSSVVGVDARFFEFLPFSLGEGRLLLDTDNTRNQRVCVLGSEAAERFFPHAKALGRTLFVNGSRFDVVGILAASPGRDGEIFIPENQPVLQERIEGFESQLSLAVISAADAADVPALASLAERILLRRHNDERDFEMTIPESLFRQQERTRDLFNSIMVLITAISLLVGGIGIMNIMLASVMERTKEIGIRRGAGATQGDIRVQFLAEAILLTSFGGIVGVIAGVALSVGISASTGWEMEIPPLAVFAAFSFSVLTGIVFGYYPARSASELNPVEALRHE
jgi:putative ABC transport system permease protein